jgi:hypothetical protein
LKKKNSDLDGSSDGDSCEILSVENLASDESDILSAASDVEDFATASTNAETMIADAAALPFGLTAEVPVQNSDVPGTESNDPSGNEDKGCWSSCHSLATESDSEGSDDSNADLSPLFDGSPLQEPHADAVIKAFMPANPFQGKSGFTGRLHVVRTVQARLAHKKHSDEHFTHTIRRMVKECVVSLKRRMGSKKFAHSVCCASSDCKSKIPVGEPGVPVSTGIQAHGSKKMISIVADTNIRKAGTVKNSGAVGLTPRASDHDFKKASLTPSVNLFQDVPDNILQSWVAG